MSPFLDHITSLKAKLGVLVAVSVVVTGLLTLLGSTAGVPHVLVLPISVALALGVTQLLAAGMVSPLRQMTRVAQAMARGDYTGRVPVTTNDEVGRLAEAFNHMAADLAAVDRERRDLITTVSHELRTPLTAMTATLENLADGVVPLEEGSLRRALEQAERLRDLVTDLLELSRLEQGVVPLHKVTVELEPLVRECIEHVRLSGRAVDFVSSVPPGLLVSADRARLAQLLRNVLDNAGRYTPHDEAVVVTAGADSTTWWLEVVDHGPGVAAEDRQRVFERLSSAGPGGGTGVGLAVARWVARLHGGALEFLDPTEGVGARLQLSVPVPTGPATMEVTPVDVPAPSSGAPSSGARSSGARAPGAQPVGSQLRPVPSPASGVASTDALFGRFWPEADGGRGTRTVVACAAAAVFGGAAMSFTEPGLSWTLILVGAGAAALMTSRRRSEPWTVVCSLLALLLVLPITLVGAWWVGMLGMLTAAAVFLCGLTGASTPLGIVLTGVSWPLASLRGLPWFGETLRLLGWRGTAPAVVRTVAWSLLGLLVFGAIFASADALFASWVDLLVPSLTFGTFVARVFVACGIFGLTLAAAYLGLNPSRVDMAAERQPAPWANRFEWLVPVLVVDAVFASFLASQTAAFFGGHAYVERTTGLTYAEYVHQGFGQLTLATVLTLLVVRVASRRVPATAADRRWMFGTLGLLCALALVVVGSALHRMSLYQDAYGFTSLRLVVDVFEGWLGVVIISVMVLGAFGRGRWVPRTAIVTGAAAVLGLAMINPDAWVAARNIDRYESTGRMDAWYIGELAPDAVPVIVDRMEPRDAVCIVGIFRLSPEYADALEDPRAWNLGRERAREALEVLPRPTRADVSETCSRRLSSFDR